MEGRGRKYQLLFIYEGFFHQNLKQGNFRIITKHFTATGYWDSKNNKITNFEQIYTNGDTFRGEVELHVNYCLMDCVKIGVYTNRHG